MKGHVLRRCPKPLAGPCIPGRCAHRWAYTFSAGRDPDTDRRRQYTGGGYRTEREAWRACRTAMDSADKGTLLSRREQRAAREASVQAIERTPTVGSYLEGWLAGKAKLRPNTRDGYATIIRMHVAPRIGGLPMTDAALTPRVIRALLEDLAAPHPVTGKVRTKATIARVRATLTSAFGEAVLDGLLTRNPATRVPLPDAAGDGGRPIEVYSPEQLGRFLDVLQADRLGALYHLDAFSGLRRGELVGLEWADVELDAGRLTVRHSITQRGGELRRGKPKTKKGERTVALDAGTVAAMRSHRARQLEERLAWGPAYRDEGLVFAREDGSPLRPDYVTRHFQLLARAAGVPVIRLHDLRHTHASHALAAGVAIKVVSERLGHSSTAITEDIYTHVVPKVAADAAELIAALVHVGRASRPASNAD